MTKISHQTAHTLIIRRLFVVVIFGVLAAIIAYFLPFGITYKGVKVGDIGPPIIGWERFMRGESPYGLCVAVGALTAYPFTTIMMVAPLTLLPYQALIPLFCGISTSIFAYALLRHFEWWRLLVFVSIPFYSFLESAHWSPLFASALILPSLLPIAIVKPQLGLVLLINGKWTRKLVMIVIGLLILSFIIYPSWLFDWFKQGSFKAYSGNIPILVLPGFLLLLNILY